MSAVTAVIHRGDAVLMVAGQDIGSDDRQWFLAGGKVEAGESFHEALSREVLEETGLRVDDASHLEDCVTAIEQSLARTDGEARILDTPG